MANEIKFASQAVSKTVYFLIINPAGLFWNGSIFEAYVTANRGTYDVPATEQGTASGIYLANFPATITSSGSYEILAYWQTGGAPAEPPTDNILGSVIVDWTGSAIVGAGTGSMSGSDLRDYILRGGFIRPDKDTEVYEAITDTIQEMRRRFSFSEAQADSTTTDSITVDGDFKMAIETDMGLLGGIVVEDGDDSWTLEHISKHKFDNIYPDINVTTDRGSPVHFTIYGDQIYIGPIPDQTTFVFRTSYSLRAGTVTSATAAVPFTNLYREVLRYGALGRLWEIMDQFQRSQLNQGKFEQGMNQAIKREIINDATHVFAVRAQDI